MPKLQKVLMLLPHIGTGGDWIFIRLLSKQLRQAGHEVQVGSTVGSQFEDLYSKKIRLNLSQGLRGFLQSLTQINQFDRDISIIHANSTNTLLFAILLQRLRCRKASIILTFHLYLEDSFIRKKLKAFLFLFADYLHCSSEKLRSHILKSYPQLELKVVLIHLAADEKTFYKVSHSEKQVYRDQFNLTESDFVLLFAGRLNPEKNIELVLETLALEQKRYPNLKLLIAGGGPSKATLETVVREKELQKQVHFIGYQSHMRPVYGACDLLVLPSSSRETFGLVIVEAALCGIPSLRSDTPGATDQIINGKNGLVYSNQIPGDFRLQLLKVLEDPEKSEKMGKQAMEVAQKKFTAFKMGEDFDHLYRKAIHKRC
jgi:glycosyltransferase involved in cell wall biosynthesis